MEAFKIYESTKGSAELHQAIGLVTEVVGGSIGVIAERQRFSAKLAQSCLLQPEVDDKVLLLIGANDCWVLAVLHRQNADRSVISFDGDVEMRSSSGSFSIEANSEVLIKAREKARLQAPELTLSVALAQFFAQRVRWLGEAFDLRVKVATVVAKVASSVSERFSLQAKTATRDIEEIEQVRAGHIDYRAEKNISLKAKNVLASSVELTKIDGKQVHIG